MQFKSSAISDQSFSRNAWLSLLWECVSQAFLCSFAALVHERLPHNPVLLEMAEIVQAADISGELDNHPAARGLQLISRGFPLVTNDNHETTERAPHSFMTPFMRVLRTANALKNAGCESVLAVA